MPVVIQAVGKPLCLINSNLLVMNFFDVNLRKLSISLPTYYKECFKRFSKCSTARKSNLNLSYNKRQNLVTWNSRRISNKRQVRFLIKSCTKRYKRDNQSRRTTHWLKKVKGLFIVARVLSSSSQSLQALHPCNQKQIIQIEHNRVTVKPGQAFPSLTN